MRKSPLEIYNEQRLEIQIKHRALLTDEQFLEHNKVFRVSPGTDAFVIPILDITGLKLGERYVPYLDVIAKTEYEARLAAADILGMNLYEQDEHPEYDNYICRDAEYLRLF